MSNPVISKINSFKKTIKIPGDKSISHRSVMLGSIASGITEVRNFLTGEDCICTQKAFQALGVNVTTLIENEQPYLKIHGRGLASLRNPENDIYLGNSGTGMRLLAGLFSGLNLDITLTGDESLSGRPMARVIKPLSSMGAAIDSREGMKAPLNIKPVKKLKAISYVSPIASAQVKSSILLAGLNADSATSIVEPEKSRDHSERMLQAFGADLRVEDLLVTINPLERQDQLHAQNIIVPGDISSAAFFIVLAAILNDAEITMLNVGMNPTRTGIIDVMDMMNIKYIIQNESVVCGEPQADLTVYSSDINACVIEGDLIPRLIDEIPVIAILAAQAKGKTIIKDAAELKVKESNRIATTVNMLKKLGVNVEETHDGMVIHGIDGNPFKGDTTSDINIVIDSNGDHRLAMSSAVAGLHSLRPVEILKSEFVNTSFPGFFDLIT